MLCFFLVVSDIDVVCDVQARTVKNLATTSQRQAAELANEGIAAPDGDDTQDSKGVGEGLEQNVDPNQPRMG